MLGKYFNVCATVAALMFSDICCLSEVSTVAGCLSMRLSIKGARTSTSFRFTSDSAQAELTEKSVHSSKLILFIFIMD